MFEPLAAKAASSTVPLRLLRRKELDRWRQQRIETANWASANGFSAKPGQYLLVPSETGQLAEAVLAVDETDNPWAYSNLPKLLPAKRYAVAEDALSASLNEEEANALALGWSLGTYQFSRYKRSGRSLASLVWPKAADRRHVQALVESIALCRDLINTPAEDLGPKELVAAGVSLAEQHGGTTKVLEGKAQLLKQFPAVYAVGRASARPPCLLDLSWGKPKSPKVTLVGKGVVFDSGGLNLKTATGMRLMKKDMGGAALVLGLAHYVMSERLPVRLRVLVPAVENSVAGNSIRPSDVIDTRKGLRVEVGNTDAEGRLILCDALAAACEEAPALLVDAATLTGAARIALGPSLPALFCNEERLAEQILGACSAARDPLWRLPLHAPYDSMLDSKVADLNNISNSGYGGAITAALFLQRFVRPEVPWAHMDTMGWNLESKPGRPVGGEALGLRGLARLLRERFPKPPNAKRSGSRA